MKKKKQKQDSLSRNKKEVLRKSARAARSITAAAIPDVGKVLGIYDAVNDTASAINAGKRLLKAYGKAGRKKINRGIGKVKRRLGRLY